MDLISHLTRQAAFSKATFGPGPRTKGVIEHIREELEEIEKVYNEMDGADPGPSDHADAAAEWVDAVLLSMDGLLRAMACAHSHSTFDQVAQKVADMINAKQGKNERREWPDWRQFDEDTAIGHVQGIED